MRSIRIVIAALCLLAVTRGAYSLGVGDITLHSALNQELRADIALVAVRPGDIDGTRAVLASPAEFRAAGIDRTLILSKLRFKVEELEDGKAVVRVSTTQPVREPYLNFLIEVSWPTGRMLREYTLLLDPPVVAGQMKKAVKAPVSQPAPEAAPAMEPVAKPESEKAKPQVKAPASEAPSDELFPRIGISEQPASTQPRETTGTPDRETRMADSGADATPSKPVETTPVETEPMAQDDELFPRIPIDGQPVQASIQEPSADEYGPTKSNDTLWSIANRLRPKGVSVEQMMLALLRANPAAFSQNNINTLKKGQVLRVPGLDDITSLTERQAMEQSREHNQSWQPASAKGGFRESRPETSKPRERVDGKPEVKLVSPEGKGEATGTSGSEDSGDQARKLEAARRKLALAREDLAGAEQRNEQLGGRVQDLEEQVASMKRLIALKEEKLAELQRRLGEQAAVPQAAPVETPAPAVAESAPAKPQLPEKPAEMAQPEVAPTPPVPAPVASGEGVNPFAVKEFPRQEVAKPVEAPAATPPAPQAEPVKPVTAPPAPAKPTPAKPTPATRPPAPIAEPPGMFDDLLGNPLYLGIGGGVILIIIVLFILYRRRMTAMQFPESILTDKGSASMMGGDKPSTEETSLLSDFAPTTMEGTIESEVGEVDPMSEADVYLAYKKYQQAEDLLKTAIGADPERIDLKLKLMEVYFAAKNADAFGALATQVHGALDDTSRAMWDKAEKMGRELCPDHPLFSGETGAEEDDLSFMELDTSEAGSEVDDELDLGLDDTGGDLDFDLGDLGGDQEDALDLGEPETPQGGSGMGGLDDLDIDFETGETPSVDLAESDDTSGDLDFDLDALAEDTGDLDLGGDLDLSGELDLDALGETEAPAMDVDLAGEPELTDDLGSAPLLEDTVAESDELISIDEVATKLDLAKAYIDMGDPDGARGILEEVLGEGNDTQKQEAQTLIGQLG